MGNATEAPTQPPEDAFWQRYSPHHELPLSCVGSIFLHAAVIGVIVLGGVGIWAIRTEANRPPSLDVVVVSGGDGMGGFAGMGGNFGEGGIKEEFVPEQPVKAAYGEVADASPILPDVPRQQLDIPELAVEVPMMPNVLAELKTVSSEAANAVKSAAPAASQKNAGASKLATAGNAGKKAGTPGGPGGGIGAPSRKLTKQEIFANRWRFDLTGAAQQHAEKLAAAGVVVVLPYAQGAMRIVDLKRRPVALAPINLGKFTDAVKWHNDEPASIAALVQELRLPLTPPYVMLLLPESRERKMAEVEADFAERTGRDLKSVRATLFDFELRNGVYEPVVRAQE